MKNGEVITVYNQIDFILVKQNQKNVLEDARAYNGTLMDSDHRIVKSKMDLKGYKMFKSKPKISKTKTYNSNILAANKDERNNYQTAIKNKLNQLVSAPSCQEITKNHN